MKLTGLVQVAVLLLLIALAASCEVSKEYAKRVFKPTLPEKKADTASTLRFMQFDSDSGVDSIDLKDFANKDATETENRSVVTKDSTKSDVLIVEGKKPPIEQPIDQTKKGSVRTKKVRQ